MATDVDVVVYIRLNGDDSFAVPDRQGQDRRLRAVMVRYTGGDKAYVNCVKVYNSGKTTSNSVAAFDMPLDALPEKVLAALKGAVMPS